MQAAICQSLLDKACKLGMLSALMELIEAQYYSHVVACSLEHWI